MNLVFINNQRPVTDSLIIAESFGKRHDNVLRDIKEMECSKEFSLLNFEESTYTAQNGQTYSKYLGTRHHGDKGRNSQQLRRYTEGHTHHKDHRQRSSLLHQ